MKIRHARRRFERLRNWWAPTLTVPTVAAQGSLPASALEGLFGYADGRQVVVVTRHGTEIPIPPGCQMRVETFQKIIADIDALPETEPRGFVW